MRAVAIILVAASSVFGNVIHVPTDQPTIQDGISVAFNGDTILVAPGAYLENLDFVGKQIVVTGSGGADSTTIEALQRYLAVVSFTSGEPKGAEISGFTITGSTFGGVYCESSSPTIRDNVITGNFSNMENVSPGINLSNSTGAIVEGNVIHGNNAHTYGAAIHFEHDNRDDTICYNVIYGNTGYGEIRAVGTLFGVSLHNNTISATTHSGVINSASGIFDVRNNIVFFGDPYAFHGSSGSFRADYNCTFNNAQDYSHTPGGDSNIYVPPLFIDTTRHDYRLLPVSPCIDAGDPHTLFDDPDGSRNDIGALFFDGYDVIAYDVHVVGEDDFHVVSADPTFGWSVFSPSGGQIAYEVEVGSDSDWTTAEMWASGTVSSLESWAEYAGVALTDGVTYWLRVRIDDGTGWSGWSRSVFRLNSVPSVPSPVWPLQSVPIAADSTWLAVENAVDAEADTLVYDFEVYLDTLTLDSVYHEYGAPEGELQTKSSKFGPLETDRSYHWRARSSDGHEYSSWSNLSSFTTRGPATIRVPQDLATIQGAVDAAGDGDTILVSWGLYVENVDVDGKEIILTSDGAAAATIIEAADVSLPTVRMANVTSLEAAVIGFTITGSQDFGITCDSSTGRVLNNIIKENQGGGLLLHYTNGVMAGGNSFYDNGASAPLGGTLRNAYSTNDTLAFNRFYNVHSDENTAIRCLYATGLQVYNNTIYRPRDYGFRNIGTNEMNIRNNIVVGARFMLGSGTDSIITAYNCVFDHPAGYDSTLPGPGNFNADPEFTDPDNGGFALGRYSPCIDAGDPLMPDNDGTRPEMGAVSYRTALPVPHRLNLGDQDPVAVRLAQPTFNWGFVDSLGSQEAYEIQTGADDDWSTAEMWSTGEVVSADTHAVYEGLPLANHAVYYTRIRLRGVTGWGGWRYIRFVSHLTNVIHVPLAFTSIQEAIVHAQDGDTVLVAPGAYAESIDYLGKSITVMASDGPEVTFLHPTAPGYSTVLIRRGEGPGTSLLGFTVENGTGNNTILIENGSRPTIAYNVIRNNHADAFRYPAVVKVVSPARVHHNIMYGNENAPTIGLHDSAIVVNNTVVGNAKGVFSRYATPTVLNNIVVGNGYGFAGVYDYLGYNNAWSNGSLNDGGENGLSVDPQFADTAAHDYHLLESSPCIDAGHPSGEYTDPDGSRSDMGALAFAYDLPLALRLNLGDDDAQQVLTATPAFYWSFHDTVGGQEAFLIEVGVDEDWSVAEMWSSGEVLSSDTSAVYAGAELEHQTVYYVRIRVKAAGRWGGWQHLEFRMHLRPIVRVPDNLPTIQKALDYARSGDSVLVAPGVYSERLVFPNKSVTLISEWGADSTVIAPDTRGETDVILVTVDPVEIELNGFTFKSNAYRTLLLAEGPLSVDIFNNVLTGHLPGWNIEGAVVECRAAAMNIHRNVIHNNWYQAAIEVHSGSIEIVNNTLDRNEYGIWNGGGTVVALNNIVSSCDNWGRGGEFERWEYNCLWANNTDYASGPPGELDIRTDPMFLNVDSGDYRLSSLSPCMDAGAPDSQYFDPDGTRNDIGARPYHHQMPVAQALNLGSDSLPDVAWQLTPTISWHYHDTSGLPQTQFEIEFGTDDDWTTAELYASGAVASSDTQVVYAGAPLEDHRFYWLRLRLMNLRGWGEWVRVRFLTHASWLVHVPQTAATIGEALSLAIGGDTILAAPGDYAEDSVVITERVVLISTHGRDSTIIRNAGSVNSLVTIRGLFDSITVVDGFTITNSSGRGVLFEGAHLAEIRNCDISYCGVHNQHGGGVLIIGSAMLRHNRIHHNTVTGGSSFAGGGIAFDLMSTQPSEICGNRIYDNTAPTGSAVAVPVFWANNPGHVIERNIIFDNVGTGDFPAAVYYKGVRGSITNNTIVGNTRGVRCLAEGSEMVIANNIFAYNDYYGLRSSASTRRYNCFWGNGSHGDYHSILDIIADPWFADTAGRDFSLLPGSPCIDAGDPSPEYNDPDGTRNDIGALYFPQQVTATNAWINLYCAEPTLDSLPLSEDECIQVYDPDDVLCGIGNVAEDGSYGFIPVYRDDPYTESDEGAEPGDELTIKIQGTRTEAEQQAVWTATGDGLEVCNFVSRRCCQVTLREGWNLVSWNVTHDEPISATTDQLGDCLEVVLSFDGQGLTYDPLLPLYSTLDRLDYYHGYWLRVSCDTSFAVCGLSIPASEFITIRPGWSLVSYWPKEPWPVEDALASVMDNLEVAYGFDQQLQVYVPGDPVHSNLTEMAPNFGYWIRSAGEGILSYPGQSIPERTIAGGMLAAADGLAGSHTWMSVYGSDITLDGRPLRSGATIEAVSRDGMVCGRGIHSSGLLMFTPIYGRDPVDEQTFGYPVQGDSVTLLIDGYEVLPRLCWAVNARVGLERFSSLKKESLPTTYYLHQNYPNPFNAQTIIKYDLPTTADVEIAIFNILGERVARLVDRAQPAGFHQVTWDGTNLRGKSVASGVYLYRIKADEFTQSKKMILLK